MDGHLWEMSGHGTTYTYDLNAVKRIYRKRGQYSW